MASMFAPVPDWVQRLHVEQDGSLVRFEYWGYHSTNDPDPEWIEGEDDRPAALRLQADFMEIEGAGDWEWYIYRPMSGWPVGWSAFAVSDGKYFPQWIDAETPQDAVRLALDNYEPST